jgi:hypothetical protein
MEDKQMITIINKGDSKKCKCGCEFHYEAEDVRKVKCQIESLFIAKKEVWEVAIVECPHCRAEIKLHKLKMK